MHVIRLRSPWEKCRLDGSEGTRIDVPETSDPQAAEQIAYRYHRNFHRPSGLQPGSSVFLRIDGWQGRLGSVSVNGLEVDTDGSTIHADITETLQPHNQLVLQLSGLPGRPARLSGEVTLAIDETLQTNNHGERHSTVCTTTRL